MILIVVNYRAKPEFVDEWMDHIAEFAAVTRAGVSDKWFEWSRSVEDPNQYTLVGAFDDDAGGAHVNSEHFAEDLEAMKPLFAETPKIVLQVLPDKQDWDRMGELQVD